MRLVMSGVVKSFGSTHALCGVNLEVRAAEVHALIGENGAGKSTLMKVLSGACTADAGTIALDGQAFAPRNPFDARKNGIAMIYQELNLAPHLCVLDNVLLGVEPALFGWIRPRKSRSMVQAVLELLGHGDLPLKEPVRNLPIASQQIVEIARTLVAKPRLLVMDEPTSSLGQADALTLFKIIRQLKATGVSVVYISHFLEECELVCDRYTVLRDGVTVGNGEMAAASRAGIISLMAGREIEDIYPPPGDAVGEIALSVKAVKGRHKPRNVSFAVRRGEIFGLAGLVGGGRTETLRAVFGLDVLRAGEVEMNKAMIRSPSPHLSLHLGMGLMSEDRKQEGLLQNRSVADNLTITRLHPAMRFGLVSSKRQGDLAQRLVRKLNIRVDHLLQPVHELSGGNQQKVALGRLLHHEADVLLLDEPTRGIDIGSKVEIYRIMRELAEEGKAIVFVSSYLPELLGVCDTIAVMCRGELVETRAARNWTEHTLMAAALGQEAET